jgi:glycolate oxidase FAD binding subunit
MSLNKFSRIKESAADVEEQLRAIVGSGHLRPASTGDIVAGVPAQFVAEPGTEQEVAAVLSCANDAGLAVIPRGGGTKLDWGNPPSTADLILSTKRLKRIEHAPADLTVIVEAGCTFGHLQEELARCGQRLAIDPLWPQEATIGGMLSSNDSGSLRLYYGGLRDLIIGSTLALADGTLASSGGKVVKNVAGYDLSKLVTGALGTLGVITRAIFRLHPLPRTTRRVSFSAESASEMQCSMLAIQDSALGHAAFQMHFAADSKPTANILLEGTEAGLTSQERKVQELIRPMVVSHGSPGVWSARQDLFTLVDAGTVAKMSVLPTNIAKTAEVVMRATHARNLLWGSVLHATGIGWLRLDGNSEALRQALEELRGEIERDGGSFIVVRQPSSIDRVEAWGNAGDASPLMRALKSVLDPKGTLNPHRFVGGI